MPTARWRPPYGPVSVASRMGGASTCDHNRSQAHGPHGSSSSTTTRPSGPAHASCWSPRGSRSWARRWTARRRCTSAAGCARRWCCSTSSCPTSTASTSASRSRAYAEHPTVIMTSSRDGSDFGPLVHHVGGMRVRAQGRALGRARAGAARPVTGLRRALGLVAIEGIVVGLVALAIVLSSDHVEKPRRHRGARRCSSAGRSSAPGLFAWWRRPDNRFGVLMTAVGFAFFLGVLTAADASLAVHDRRAASRASTLAVFVHMLLAYPDGRIDSPQLRKVLAAGYALSIVGPLPTLLFADPSGRRLRRLPAVGDPHRHDRLALRRPRRAHVGARGGPRRLRPLRAGQALAGRHAAAAARDGAGAVVGHLPARRCSPAS